MPLSVIDILHGCRFFANVSPQGFARLAAMARLCRYEKGATIFRENDPCPGVFVVGAGLVRVFKTGPGGKEHVLHMVGPGGTFAEVAAVGGFNVPAGAEAVTKTTCTLLPLEPFRRALREDHALCLDLMTGMTLWVRRLVGLVEDIALRDAAGRLARYLLTVADEAIGRAGAPERDTLELPALKRHVASHLNLTSETFSRTLRRLVDAGLVEELGTARLRLLDRRKLRLVAEGMFPEL
jgi:CRP/FNR family transcriptional regulator, dissimilatory nitrate respiration regulator